MKDVDCDFLAFSAHKMTGPTGVGILYGKMKVLKKCKIVKFGGGMVDKITEDNIRYKEIPDCFECGTPAIENIIGFSYSLRYLLDIGYKDIEEYMKELDTYMYNKLKELDNIEFIFPISKNHIPIFTFINKMDRDAKDTFDLLDDIEKELGIPTCAVNWPIGSGKGFKGVYDRA